MPADMTKGAKRVSGPLVCVKRLQQAINAHDLKAMADCFEADYTSEFPAHPERAFRGHTSMRKNWSQIFNTVPDIHAEMLNYAVDGDTVWTEWEWTGTRIDGMPFLYRGLTIQAAPQDRITWARLYMEPVQEPLVAEPTEQSVDSAPTK